MGKFNMWMQRILYGRYGIDSLNKFLLTVSFVLIAAGLFYHGKILRIVTVMLLIYIYCRMFSRNHVMRARENQKFLEMTSDFRKNKGGSGSYRSGTGYGAGYGSYARAARPQKDKDHKILRCPTCGAKLRVPKGVGKINITCPHCNLKFIKKV